MDHHVTSKPSILVDDLQIEVDSMKIRVNSPIKKLRTERLQFFLLTDLPVVCRIWKKEHGMGNRAKQQGTSHN